MVLDDFKGLCRTVFPAEAHPPLLVDAIAVLSVAIPLQLFESIRGGTRRAARRSFLSVWTASDVLVALLHASEDTDGIVQRPRLSP